MIEEPNLNCAHCYSLRSDYQPACEYGQCEIEDLAADPDIQAACDEFIQLRTLYLMSNDPVVYGRLCDRFGLHNDPELHLALEVVFKRWQRKIEAEAAKK